MKQRSIWIIFMALWLVFLSGCGSSNENVVSIFVYPQQGKPTEFNQNLQEIIQEKINFGDKEFRVSGGPIYDIQVLVVQIASGEHDILILSEEDMVRFLQTGDGFALDDWFDPDDYPDGVVELVEFNDEGEPEKTGETAFYALPVHNSQVIQNAGKVGDEPWYAIVHPRTDDLKEVQQIMQLLAE